MAGSYSHCRGYNGKFSFQNIENMRDAYEACEMMFWMIGHLAKFPRDIEAAQEAYFAHLRVAREDSNKARRRREYETLKREFEP